MNRRDFLKKSTVTAGIIPFMGVGQQFLNVIQNDQKLPVCIFSKHLQFLDYKSLGEKTSEMGFTGIDLTVRPDGHVRPQSVEKDLPKAVEEIRKGGSQCIMMSTVIEKASSSADVAVLNAASDCGIKYYRTNWFKYPTEQSMPEALNEYSHQIMELGELNKKLNLVGCYQNHAGTLVGSSIWEVYKIIESANQQFFGAQYDIRHAMVEGAISWTNGFELIHNRIKTIVLKDFRWEKVKGKWQLLDVPIGEGMVDFVKYFGLLKKYKINAPISLHCEYDLGGAEKGNRKISVYPQVVFDAMSKDLKKIQQLWIES
jgi:L-ribulose-5-phosphate 3-epimerase